MSFWWWVFFIANVVLGYFGYPLNFAAALVMLAIRDEEVR